jgi:4-hydroxy-3-methylbut-2-enyl diphosphate reductase
MAIKALAWMVRIFEPPVYCYHEIVHNRLVVERFEALGVIFVDDIASVPANVPLMLSAHGSAPEVVDEARAHGRFVVNAVCPLVTKVHHEAKVRAGKGYTILYVGHAGHDEAVGTLAVAPESIRLVEHEEDGDKILGEVSDPTKVALLAQTTLALHDWQGITERARDEFPDLWPATRNDLCFATNRQGPLAIAARADAAVVVIGSATRRTRSRWPVAHSRARSLRIDGTKSSTSRWRRQVVGVTAGASAPRISSSR